MSCYDMTQGTSRSPEEPDPQREGVQGPWLPYLECSLLAPGSGCSLCRRRAINWRRKHKAADSLPGTGQPRRQNPAPADSPGREGACQAPSSWSLV
ncbi:hypothetical protein NDU88_012365 [Pleurodeles waltl]|uniref:Uncharacterized protein n=1 Tax=Pleurodeles waltl TaxID=8319 RepID=A0AAV7R5M0_PLEWA|nr:hypothetical protein NDU88_012365 [Pleurodeles waltl]